MLAGMVLLIVRRWYAEQHQGKISTQSNAMTRAYLQRLGGADVATPAAGPVALATVLHLSQLLRGAERERLLAIAEDDGLFDLALRKVRHSGAPDRARAIQMLMQFGDERSVHALLERMAGDPIPSLRLEAAGALAVLGRLPPPAETIGTLGLAKGPLTRVHSAVLRSLAQSYPLEMGNLLRGDFPAALPIGLRRMVVDALGWSGDYSVAELIEEAARDDHPEIRCAALRSARQLGRSDAGEWILPLLADPVAEVRVNAIRACDTLRIRQAVTALERLCADPDWWVRSRAEEALVGLRPAGAVDIAA